MLALEWTVWLGQTSRVTSTFFLSNRGHCWRDVPKNGVSGNWPRWGSGRSDAIGTNPSPTPAPSSLALAETIAEMAGGSGETVFSEQLHKILRNTDGSTSSFLGKELLASSQVGEIPNSGTPQQKRKVDRQMTFKSLLPFAAAALQ